MCGGLWGRSRLRSSVRRPVWIAWAPARHPSRRAWRFAPLHRRSSAAPHSPLARPDATGQLPTLCERATAAQLPGRAAALDRAVPLAKHQTRLDCAAASGDVLQRSCCARESCARPRCAGPAVAVLRHHAKRARLVRPRRRQWPQQQARQQTHRHQVRLHLYGAQPEPVAARAARHRGRLAA
eukprot:365190-Chlamydomonas_euryale.AAC.6